MAYVTTVRNRGMWLDIARGCCAFVAVSRVTEYGIAHTSLSFATGADQRGTLLDFVRVLETMGEARLR